MHQYHRTCTDGHSGHDGAYAETRARIGLTLDFHTCCQGDVDEALKAMGEVVEAHYTDGEWDTLIRVQARDPAGLMTFLQKLNAVAGITNSRTIISLANPIRSV